MRLSIKAVIAILDNKNWSRPQIAKVFGVTTMQVWLYYTGKTKTPGPKVCMNIYNNIKLEGTQVLIDIYETYKDLEEHYNLEVNDGKAVQG